MNLCPYKNMDKCAQQYCDFWNKTEHMCVAAIEMHERAALWEKLNNFIDGAIKESIVKVTKNINTYISKMDRSKFN